MSQADELQQRADTFADRSIEFVEGLPSTMTAQRIGGQYLDASTSVAANYRAARRGRSYAEFTAKMGVVAEEADESVFWLHRLAKARINSTVAMEPLLAEAVELAKIFTAAARTARKRRGGK
jgi:four helix bundle protein